MNELCSFLQKNNLKIFKTNGDGNCLFSSLSLYIKKKAKDIREDVVNYIRNDEELYKHVEKTLVNQKMSDYLDNMQKDGTWGGEPEIIAASRMYNKKIIIITPKNIFIYSGYGLICVFSIQFEEKDENIYLFYNGLNHYDSIIKE